MRWLNVVLVMTLAASCTVKPAASRFEWEAAPKITIEILDDHRIRLTAENVEARAICINASEWPGPEGRLSGDDFEVIGQQDAAWRYTGIEKYPTQGVVRIEPGGRLGSEVNLSKYYVSKVASDRLAAVKWKLGFVYCDAVSNRS